MAKASPHNRQANQEQRDGGQPQPETQEIEKHIAEDQKTRERENMLVEAATEHWRMATVEEYEDLARHEEQQEEEQLMVDMAQQDQAQEEAEEAYQQYQQQLWLQLQGEAMATTTPVEDPAPTLIQEDDEEVIRQ